MCDVCDVCVCACVCVCVCVLCVCVVRVCVCVVRVLCVCRVVRGVCTHAISACVDAANMCTYCGKPGATLNKECRPPEGAVHGKQASRAGDSLSPALSRCLQSK